MRSKAFEVNFDGIVGQTHHYGGLAYGNLPSIANQYTPSNPKEAALQGLKKMKLLADLGVMQAVLPPHERPHLPTLRRLGFAGTDEQVVRTAYKLDPELFFSLSSASAMWTANAATVSPSADSRDGKVHFTPANLCSHLHRSIETAVTGRILKAIFNDPHHFAHHSSLPASFAFTDEGAANHNRVCRSAGEPGIQIFVYGRRKGVARELLPQKFPARQSHEASLAISRLHQLDAQRVLFVQQHPKSIDAGAFHHDLIGTYNENLLLFHQYAYLDKEAFLAQLRAKAAFMPDLPLRPIEVKEGEISLQDAIDTFFFNSQLLNIEGSGVHLVAPVQCAATPSVKRYIDRLLEEQTIAQLHTIDLLQSMQNGGGPACLRLRVVLTPEEKAATLPTIFLTDALYTTLVTWVKKHYRERLLAADLADPQLLREGHAALDELTQILQLGPIYDFQGGG